MAELGSLIRDLTRPLRTPGDLDPLLDRIGGARVVLLGEAPHGTHEYHAWRAALTHRLVTERGFSLVGVEGDRPDCCRSADRPRGASAPPGRRCRPRGRPAGRREPGRSAPPGGGAPGR